MKVLIVEDEPSVSDFIAQALAESGCETQVVATAKAAKEALGALDPDLIILDAMLPDGDGFELLPAFRELTQAPVLMVTARGSLEDRVRGLDAGADDYLAKPFRLEELLARVRALLRRSRQATHFRLGPLEIDFMARRVTMSGRVVFLSSTEYGVLELLAKNAGSPVAKAEILRQVWDDAERDTNVVEVYVNYLRHKLERANAPRLIQTVRGHGYELADAE